GGAAGNGGRAGSSGGGGAGCPGLVCDDFESGAIDSQKWQTLTSGGTAAVQTQQVAHGTHALHLHGLGSGSDDWAILVAKNVPAGLKRDTTYGRMNVYWGAEAAVGLHAQFPFAGHNGTGTNAGTNGALYQGKSSGLIGGFDTFGVGFHDWHPAKAFDVYYDDVVLDSKRIGCP